jgi:superfamily II DNA or RNA helicase
MCTGSGKSRVIREISLAQGRRILVFPWLDLLKQYYGDHKDAYTSETFVRYFATEGTLKDIERLSSDMKELDGTSYLIFTTYSSAPLIYSKISADKSVDLIIHDEAHRIERPEYATAFTRIVTYVKHTVNLSATLPKSKEAHYQYSLLRGIKEGVVRDFHMELFLCVDKERSETKLIETIIEKLHSLHSEVKLLIYTAEANTEGESASSVKTFMDTHAKKLRERGWWIEGIKDDTKDRTKILREFEKHREISVLVSCRTLSEGIDLKNANCMLPWDPSASVVTNIQRIGRVLRLYKTKKEQTPSTVLIPVFLDEETYTSCQGDREKVNEVLCKEISEGERGNFRPIVNVCTALKNELADDDPDLFNRLLDYPYEPKVEVNHDLVECVAKQCKKSSETVLEEIATALEGKVEEEQLEDLREGEWDEEINGQVIEALVETQGITLVVKDGEEVDMFGKGETVVTVEKKDEGYKVVKDKKEAVSDKETAQKRVAQRMRIAFSDDCKILLGLESIEGAETAGGMVLTRLTTEVQYDEDWEKRRLEWAKYRSNLSRNPSIHSNDKNEKRAAQWQADQRKYYKKKAIFLTPQRVALLESTPGWSWEQEDLWEPNRQNWITQSNKFGKNPNKHSHDENEKRAARWQEGQRTSYRKNETWMTQEKITILESTPGWTWMAEDAWEKSRQNWIAQSNRLCKSPNKHSDDENEKKAGIWQCAQRKSYKQKEKTLTNERIAILEATAGWTWMAEDPWEKSRQHWISEKKKLGTSPSASSENSSEKKAGVWQYLQRKAYKEKDINLSPGRISILASTSGWTWEEEDEWEKRRLEWLDIYKKLRTFPSSKSENKDERNTAQWQNTQRQAYKKKEKRMTSQRISILESTPGWSWQEKDKFELCRQHWTSVYQKLGYFPSNNSKDTSEKKAAQWQNNQRRFYKEKDKWMTPERIQILESTPGWTWSNNEEPKTPAATTQPRTRKPVKAKAESTGSGQQRQRSQLEEYHKRFKTMNASTYKSSITAEDFTAYHAIADSYDAKDPVERQPIHKIATLLSKYNKPSYSAIDLGCGKNRLRVQEAVSKMKWTSVDVHKVDDSVIQADMAALPYDDESYDFAILSRSLWARNHLDVMKETLRILKSGGRAVICESFQRWMKGSENELLHDLKATGFEIVYEEGTRVEDTVEDVFQYVVVRKG